MSPGHLSVGSQRFPVTSIRWATRDACYPLAFLPRSVGTGSLKISGAWRPYANPISCSDSYVSQTPLNYCMLDLLLTLIQYPEIKF